MGWLANMILSPDQRMMVDGAVKLFAEVCLSDTMPGQIYREHPARRDDDWKVIRKEIVRIGGLTTHAEMTRAVRQRLADATDAFVMGASYLKLSDAERGLIAAHVMGKALEVLDAEYWQNLSLNYAYSEIFWSFIDLGWTGSSEGKEAIADLRVGLIDSSKETIEHVLEISRHRAEGRELPDDRQSSVSLSAQMKSLMKRTLAGEAVT